MIRKITVGSTRTVCLCARTIVTRPRRPAACRAGTANRFQRENCLQPTCRSIRFERRRCTTIVPIPLSVRFLFVLFCFRFRNATRNPSTSNKCRFTKKQLTIESRFFKRGIFFFADVRFLILFYGPRWYENIRRPAVRYEIKYEISSGSRLNARLIFRLCSRTDLLHRALINASGTEQLRNGDANDVHRTAINYREIVWKQSRLITVEGATTIPCNR